MRKYTIAHILLPMAFFLILKPAVLPANDTLADDFVAFSEIYDEDCGEKGGMRVFVQNQHDNRLIDLHLDRYFSGVRQGGRSMFALAPGTSQALGCSRALEASQNWKLIHAEFISPANATSRYGEVIGSAQTK